MIDPRSIAALTVISLLAIAAAKEELGPNHHSQEIHEPVVDDKQKRFYSWEGGKRWDSSKGADQKRKFYAYNNKRHDGEMEKRKFYAWAGKRTPEHGGPPVVDEGEDELKALKRKFYAWAGKRSEGGEREQPEPYEAYEKRKFYSFHQKRNPAEFEPFGEHPQEAKRKFYAWAGRK